MLELRSSDPAVAVEQQLGEALAPALLINVFTVDAKDVDVLPDTSAHDANGMKRQAG